MLQFDELLRVFAQSESDQLKYFPKLKEPIWIRFGVFDTEADSSRFIALALLFEGTTGKTDFSAEENIYNEIYSLTNLLIETSGIYPWMMRDRMSTPIEDDGAVDPAIYGNWAVLRRLSRIALGGKQFTHNIPSFAALTSEFIGPAI